MIRPLYAVVKNTHFVLCVMGCSCKGSKWGKKDQCYGVIEIF